MLSQPGQNPHTEDLIGPAPRHSFWQNQMDVTEWLHGLGLERYAPAFRDNDIDKEVLHRLTTEDLRELGVASIGHRRRLLDAIAALGDDQPAAEPSRAPAPATGAAERRQLTVMFCDLVGSTALSTRFDPEDLSKVIRSYQSCVATIIARFDGFVARYVGDGVLIYFGWPEARETDAERAVRGALAVIAAIGQSPTFSGRLRVRIGLATGLVVIGEPIGTGDARQQTAIGETPNLAARLQALAGPDTVVICASTQRQIGGLFEIEDLGPQRLAGFAEPQRAWRVSGESGVVSRFEALRSEDTPLVGREEELDLLLRRWHQAKAGNGRVVLVSGEAGIGKSRLGAALSQCIEAEMQSRLRYFCLPHHQGSALYPFIVQLEHAAGFARHDTVEQKLSKLRERLAPLARGGDEIELLAELLLLPTSAAELNLSPQRKRAMRFDALLYLIETFARNRPVLMFFEDAHWIDPTSRELLDLMFDRVPRMPVLLIITFRPEFQHVWDGQPHVTTLTLNRLGGGDGVALVKELAGDASLPPEIVDEIVARADGVPLFVEELTKAVLESGDHDNRVPAVLMASPLPEIAIPATLHASLIARLDRLGPTAREVAQIGAVIGREFGYDLIERVAQRPPSELHAGLARLVEAGLLFCRGTAPNSSFLFKHALVQDTAYATLLRTRRQEAHARVAAVLAQDFTDVVERQPELLAHHLSAAGDSESAVGQWLKAGQYATARLAHLEAIRHFERGLASLAQLPKGPAGDGREIELQLARGLALFTAGGYSSVGAADAYARARELAEQQGNPRQLFLAVYGLWQSANGAGRTLECSRLSNRLQQLAGKADDEERLQAHHSAWSTCMYAGELAAAREHCEAGNRLYDPERHRSHRLIYGGHDPGVCARKINARTHWLLGYPEKGLVLANESVALAERIAHPFTLVDALLNNALLCLDYGAPEAALQQLGTAETLAAEQRLGLTMEPRFLRGAALSAQGEHEEAIACLRAGLADRLGVQRSRSHGFTILAEALARQGQHNAALAAAREGLRNQEQTGYCLWEAELRRLEGISLFGLSRLEEAENALEQALLTARRQQARAYELRAATSLTRLWGERGRRGEARDMLARVYGWFTEGFDTADLKHAKALLDEIN